jgi:hypothetical protein
MKPRAKLSEAEVLAIFQARESASMAARLATIYGVNEKTVRDIWTGRTWSRETWHLDTSRPIQLKATGRPKGCRDKRPRKSRVTGLAELSAMTVPTTQAPHCPVANVQSSLEIEHDALHMPMEQHWSSTDSAAILKDPVAGARSVGAARWTSTNLFHASVDEQLHEWNEFWRARTSSSEDPFCFDWTPQQ